MSPSDPDPATSEARSDREGLERSGLERPGLDRAQLVGVTIGVTSDRRSDELIGTFTRRGAQVVHAPTMRIVPVTEDDDLLAGTRSAVADPPQVLLATTGIGMRAWVEAADAAGLADDLLAALQGAHVVARGPKARGALRAAGLPEHWTAASEQTAEAVEHLVAEGVEGRSVLVQMHGAADLGELQPLVDAGALVRTVTPYHWRAPRDPAAVDRLVDAVVARSLDAVTFTAAPAAVALLDAAAARGVRDEVVAALAAGRPGAREGGVLACAVGDVTAAPLRAAGVEPLVPARWRLGALMRELSDHLVTEPRARVTTPAGELVVRARAAVLDGRVLEMAPGPLAVLARLAAAGGGVVPRADLLAALPSATDDHAVDVAVGRVRAVLPDGVVRTVVKRGYRVQAA
ncbi:uroporphyrinogen-III synthase [uncultured Pseudokineococcus sp.]|uniref:uroporphyrinogen-III synthase n=1 Tax=uncultured Pseudokineococcus sp. TaxID=1642928 RepID=UPI002610B12B|nr:uroporphyrinogen-III synthase [uncultured Pseudokineococcus sp.]